MSTARSAFTEAIEDHLALKKQNASIEASMPLARYDVGDPLDRYPGGPNRSVEPEAPAAGEDAGEATQVLVGPSPEQAMEAATALEHGFSSAPFEPLAGMAPMLSLVEDLDEVEPVAEAPEQERVHGEVLRFPGGVGPRDEEPVEAVSDEDELVLVAEDTQLEIDVHAMTQAMPAPTVDAVHEAAELDATGEQPVLVIDTDEPLATSDWSEPREPARRSKPRFFGLGRKRKDDVQQSEGWFTDGPRDFNWD